MSTGASGRWGFRVATRPEVGEGHLARGIALAAATGQPALFFVDPDCPSSASIIESAGFSVLREKFPDSCDNGLAALRSHEVDGLVVDGPHFGSMFADAAAKHGLCIEIDDGTRITAAQFVVRPGLSGGDLKTTPAQIVAAGPTYALLKRAFADAHVSALRTGAAPSVRRILIAAGAFDSPNLTKLALTSVATAGIRVPVTVVLGGQAPHLAEIEHIVSAMPNVTLRISVHDMAALYREHDLCIGAPGVSLLERSCCGLPSILASQSDAQDTNAEAAVRLGCARYLGCCRTLDPHVLAETLDHLMQNNAERLAMRESGLRAIDGRGAERVARLMKALVQGQPA